jgi:hypothetical protein
LLYNLLYYLNYRAYTRDVCRRGNEKAVAFCNKNGLFGISLGILLDILYIMCYDHLWNM